MHNNFLQHINQSAPVRTLVKLARETHLPGFGNASLYEVAKRFKEQVRADNLTERASAISFNFAMAIPPTLIFLFTLIPFLPISQHFVSQLYALIRDIVPGQNNYRAIVQFLDDLQNRHRGGLLSFGVLLSLFFSSNAIMGVMRSFDKNYPGFIKRKGLKKRLAAIRITVVLYLLFLVYLGLMAGQKAVLIALGIRNHTVVITITWLRWLIMIFLFFIIIAIIYRYVPSVQKRWKILTPGSVVATLLMLIGALGFSWWVSRFGNYHKLYGSIGTLMVIMALIFLNSFSLLVGFELNLSIYSVSRDSEPVDARGSLDDGNTFRVD